MKTQTVPLGEVCEFVYGEALKEENRRGGKVPVYGSNGVVGWHDKALTRGATIVVGRKGSIGEVNWSNGPCFPIDTTYYVEKTKLPADLRWLYYTLLRLDLTRLNKSAAIPGLNRDDAYEQRILLPDLIEQNRIAALLDQAERLRRVRRYAYQLADTILPAAFLELFGDPKQNPHEWPQQIFSNVCLKFSDGPFGSNLKSSHYRSAGCSATIRTPARVDSRLLLPVRSRCLMKMLPVLFEWDKQQIEEAVEFGNKTRIDRRHRRALPRSRKARQETHS